MATGNGVYLDTEKKVWLNTLNINVSDLKVALYTSALAIDRTVVSPTYGAGQFSGTEISGTGYTAGGKAVTGFTLTISNGELVYLANDLLWTTSSFTTRYGVLYQVTGGAVIYVMDFLVNITVTAQDFPLRLSSGLWANPQ